MKTSRFGVSCSFFMKQLKAGWTQLPFSDRGCGDKTYAYAIHDVKCDAYQLQPAPSYNEELRRELLPTISKTITIHLCMSSLRLSTARCSGWRSMVCQPPVNSTTVKRGTNSAVSCNQRTQLSGVSNKSCSRVNPHQRVYTYYAQPL